MYRTTFSKWKWSSLSPCSVDFEVSRTHVCHYVVVWNALCKGSDLISTIFSWDVPVTTLHGVRLQMPLNRSIHDTRIITPLDITLYCTVFQVTSWWGWTHIHAELSWSQSELFCIAYFHNYVFAVSSVYGLILYLWHGTFVLLQGNWESIACCTFINKLKSPDFWQAVASL